MISNLFNKHKKEAAATLLFVIALIWLLACKMPVSQAVMQIQFDQSYEERQVKIYYIPKGENQEDITTQITSGNQAEVFVQEENYQLDGLEIEYELESQSDRISQLLFSFRGKVNGDIKADKIYAGAEVEYNNGTISVKLSREGLDEYNKMFSDDWRLKVELGSILLAVYLLFLVRRVPAAYWSRFRWRGVLIFGAAAIYCLISLVCFKELRNSANRVNLYIESEQTSDILGKDETYKQSFTGKHDMQGVSVKFGTYQTKLSGNYIFRLYQGEEQLPIFSEIFNGSGLKDNNFYDFFFTGTKIQGGETYYFSICAEQDYAGEALSLYMGNGDNYQEGQLYVNDSLENSDIVFAALEDGPNRFLIVWGCFTMFYLCVLLVLAWKAFHIKNIMVVRIIYIFAMLFSLVKLGTYFKYADVSLYDELAQISYVAYMEEHPDVIVPDFSDVYVLMPYNKEKQEDVYNNLNSLTLNKDGAYIGKDSGIINYLGHPPFYFHLMKLVHAVNVQGDKIIIDVVKLRIFNIALVMSALCFIFYIGYTRIKKNPAVHLSFVSTILAMHTLFYVGASVNNDNLTLIGVTIFIFGAIRYAEKKYTISTYLIVALGLVLSLWSKMTAGLMCVVAALVLVSLTFYAEKSISSIFNKKFWFSLPVYLLGGAYFIYLLAVTGTVQPTLASYGGHQYRVAEMVYKPAEGRDVLSVSGFLKHFLDRFFTSWAGGVPGTTGGIFSISKIGNLITAILPLGLFIKKCLWKTEGKTRVYISIFSGIIFTFIAQILRGYRDFQFVSGHASTQSRYYLCMALFFGLVVAYFMEKLHEEKKHIVKIQLRNSTICLSGPDFAVLFGCILSGMLFYSGFINSIVNIVCYPL